MENTELNNEIHAMKADIQQLRTDLAEFRGTLKDEIADRAEQARGAISARAAKAKNALRSGIEEAKQKGSTMAANVEDSVVEHPLGTLAAAFSIGFVVAKILDHDSVRRHNGS